MIQVVLPSAFCALPPLTALLIVATLPALARGFYLDHVTPLDIVILCLGTVLFLVQVVLAWHAMRWRGPGFDERPDLWINNLAQSAEWFPLLGLIGTVAGTLQPFSRATEPPAPQQIIQLYAPAITATGSGLFMALLNILPAWTVLVGRGLILTLAGDFEEEPPL